MSDDNNKHITILFRNGASVSFWGEIKIRTVDGSLHGLEWIVARGDVPLFVEMNDVTAVTVCKDPPDSSEAK